MLILRIALFKTTAAMVFAAQAWKRKIATLALRIAVLAANAQVDKCNMTEAVDNAVL